MLRHSFACRLINAGASLKEIYNVLRHRSLNTTTLYTKVDLKDLYRSGPTLAREDGMKRTPSMVSLVKDYLNCRRKLGVELLREGSLLLKFARFADQAGHSGPLTQDLAEILGMYLTHQSN